jgi:hypothetical protein
MIRLKLARWVRIAALVGGCSGVDPTETPLGEEFELAPNQSTRIVGSDLTIGFRRVVGDSRCPIDAVCIVEGKAGIELELFGASSGAPVLIDSPLPTTWTDGRYTIQLLDLRPHTTTKQAIKPEDYRLRLVVSLTIPG